MAEGVFIPPWLSRDYDPVGTFMRAYQTGAQISEAQTRLAEQQRQATMEAQARQEQLQANMLRAMTETAVQKAYQEEQIALRQQDLAQEKARYDALGQQAAASLAAQIKNQEIMRALREREVAVKEGQAEGGKIHFGTGGQVLRANPDGTIDILSEGQTTPKATMGEAALAQDKIKKMIAERDMLSLQMEGGRITPTKRTGFLGMGAGEPNPEYAETQKKISDLEREIASMTATSMRPAATTNAPLSNLPPPVPPGPQASQYKVGGIYRKGSQRLRYLGGDPTNESSWEEVK